MSWRDCAASIRTAAGRDLTDDQVSDIFEAVQRRGRALTAAGKIDGFDQRLRDVVADDAGGLAVEAALKRRNAALSVIARDRMETMIVRHVEEGLSYRKSVLAFEEGTMRGIPGGRNSVASTKLAYEGEFVGGMMARMTREVPHAERMLRDREFQNDVVREMVELREGGQPGRTGNRDAAKVAPIFRDFSEISRVRLNELGANIGKLDGWAGAQIHNSDRVGKVSWQDWVAAILPKLDLARTFPELLTRSDVERALKNVWENVVFSPDRSFSRSKPEFRAPFNVARSMEQHRVLHFKSADDWLAYNETFGQGHVFDSMVAHQHRAASAAGQMDMMGPNPPITMQAVLENLKRRIDSDDRIPANEKQPAKDALTDADNTGIGSAMRIASDSHLIPHNRFWADVGSTTRAVESWQKLGGAVISSISDLVTNVVNLRFNGLSFGDSLRYQIGGMLEGRGNAEMREISYLSGEGFDGAIGHIISPFVAHDSAPGAVQAVTTRFFRWTGLTWWTDVGRAVSARVLNAHLGSNVGKAFDALPDRLQHVFSLHDITPAMWDIARASGGREVQGKRYLTPDDIADRDVQLAFRRYYADEAASSVLESDAAVQRVSTMGQQRGTPTGEATRFVMQFKGYPIAFTQRTMARAFHGGPDQSSAGVAHVGALIAGLTVMGYAAMTIKDVLRGYEPRQLFTPDDVPRGPTILAAMLQSGGAGIYGDFLFGEASRSGNSELENLTGPLPSDAARLLKLFRTARDGDTRAGAALDATLRSTPFLNVFYARPVLDYLILNELQEALAPGMLSRRDARRQRDFGQSPMLAPQDRIGLDLF